MGSLPLLETDTNTARVELVRSPHILISAFACDPYSGSEDGVGWSWVKHLSTLCRLSVITHGENRDSIATWLKSNDLPNVRFYFVNTPQHLRVLRHGRLKHNLYYMAWQWMALRVAKRIFTTDPFDIAHHITYASVQMPIFLQNLPVPLIFGPVGGGEMGHRSFWSSGGAKAFVYEWARTHRMQTLHRDPLVNATLRKAVRIFVTTPQTALFIPNSYGYKTTVMPTIGSEASFIHPPSRVHEFGHRIFAVGQLDPFKGFHLAIRAFARVAPHYPKATFTIIGQGSQRSQLERLIVSEGVKDRVQLSGWMPRAEVLRHIRDNDVFLFPSLHDSGGMAVLEAMAAAKPVICLDTGGPGIMVTPECGIKVPVTTPAQVIVDLAEALKCLLDNAELCQQMGDAARQRVLNEFSWERKAKHMLTVYTEIMANGGRDNA